VELVSISGRDDTGDARRPVAGEERIQRTRGGHIREELGESIRLRGVLKQVLAALVLPEGCDARGQAHSQRPEKILNGHEETSRKSRWTRAEQHLTTLSTVDNRTKSSQKVWAGKRSVHAIWG